MHGGKAAADPKRFSGDGSAPPRLSVWFSALFVFVACACRGGAKRRRSRIKTSTRHGCKLNYRCDFCQKRGTALLARIFCGDVKSLDLEDFLC